MRILKTTQTYYPYLSKGGPPVKVRGLARALVGRGHHVTVLTADLGGPDQAADDASWQRQKCEFGWTSRRDDIEAIYLPGVASYRATTISPRVVSFCLGRLAEFDVVHVYGLYDLIGPVVARFCRRRGLPYVVEPLGMFQPKVRSRQKKRLYHSLVGKRLLRDAAIVIATSETERQELIEGGIPESKIVLRRNGVDLSEFASLPARGAFRATLGIGEGERVILFLGRLSLIKGLDVLVRAFAEVAVAQCAVRLIIAGPDDADGCHAALGALVERFSLSDRVIISGPLYGDRKLEAFADADLFVLPSQYESFGNAAAEAVACGLPVLVTEGCGIAPLVRDQAGLVVDCAVESLRDGLLRLLENDSLMFRLRAATAIVARELSWDEPVVETERIYASLIAKPQLSPSVTAAASSQV